MSVCILGSLNIDLVLAVNHIPSSGETINAISIEKHPGGKGANQAVAAARLGAEVHMIGKVGADENGRFLLKRLKADQVETGGVLVDNQAATGCAMICVDPAGSNSIVVVSGANMKLTQEELALQLPMLKAARVVVAQLETPVMCAVYAFREAKGSGAFTLLNPSPATALPKELFEFTDVIVPNEGEALALTGHSLDDVESARKTADALLHLGCRYAAITLGERGVVIASPTELLHIPAFNVKVVDTTAAGDAFLGALASRLAQAEKLDFNTLCQAAQFAVKVSSIAVQRVGAQPSLPYLHEIYE